MPTYAHPGVYVEEIPSGVNAIEGVGTSTAAFLGYTRRGPIGEPVRITKLDDYEDIFGGVYRTEPGDDPDYMGHAVNAYYLNGGSSAYIVRVTDENAVAAEGLLLPPGAPPGSDALFRFVAENEGMWAHDYRVVVMPKADGTTYTVTVERREIVGGTERWSRVELFDGVSFDATNASTYIVPVVGDGSTIVNVQEESAAAAMRGESRSGDLSDLDDFTALNGDDLVVRVGTTDRTVEFGAAEFDATSDLADVAAAIETDVRTGGAGAAVTQFTCTVDGDTLVLTSGATGPATTVTVTGGTAAPTLQLGAANGGTERTGEQALSARAAQADPPGWVLTLSDGADGGDGDANAYGDVFDAFLKIRDVNTIVLPGKVYAATADKTLLDTAISHCEQTMSRMTIVDVPATTELADEGDVLDLDLPTSTYAVTYYPWVNVTNPYYHPESAPEQPRTHLVPPSPFAAGMWGRIDARRGVWKAPAGTETGLLGVTGLEYVVEDGDQDVLNPLGVNCLRRMPGYGNLIWGARTRATQAVPEWRYVPVRRTAIFIERSIFNGIQWAVFEPNNHVLWGSLRANIGSFMNGLFRSGAFQGEKASDAYFVRCGLGDTMVQGDIDRGQVIVIVGFAPLKPAEFVIIRIQQKVAQQ